MLHQPQCADHDCPSDGPGLNPACYVIRTAPPVSPCVGKSPCDGRCPQPPGSPRCSRSACTPIQRSHRAPAGCWASPTTASARRSPRSRTNTASGLDAAPVTLYQYAYLQPSAAGPAERPADGPPRRRIQLQKRRVDALDLWSMDQAAPAFDFSYSLVGYSQWL